MKPIAALAAFLFAACSSGAELNSRVLRLIGADARMVTGADLDRQSSSALGSEFQSQAVPDTDTRSTYKVLWIRYDAANGPATLTVVIGSIPVQDPNTPAAFTALDTSTMVAGDPDTIREAQRRWTVERPPSPLAEKAHRLSQSYDNWFLLLKPFSVPAAMPQTVSGTAAPLMRYRQELIDAVDEVSGGIRFGPFNELYLEGVFRKPEDASAAATIARWLPGMLQLQRPYDSPGLLVDAIEDVTFHAEGQRAYVSLRIPNNKVEALFEARKLREKASER